MINPDVSNDVLIGWAENGTVQTCFMSSVLNAFSEDASRSHRRLTEYYYATGPYIHDNRSRIARYMLECTDKQWLWMVDNDIQFGPNTLYRLLSAAEKFDTMILGAAYWNQYPASQCYLSWLVFTPDGIKAVPGFPEDRSMPTEVTAVGMGCTLIHRDVLEAVANLPEYVNDPWDTFAADMLIQFEDGGFLIGRMPDDFEEDALEGRRIAGTQRMGEDVTFCLRARKAGFKTWGLPSLEVEHYKPHFMTHGSAQETPKVPVSAIFRQ